VARSAEESAEPSSTDSSVTLTLGGLWFAGAGWVAWPERGAADAYVGVGALFLDGTRALWLIRRAASARDASDAGHDGRATDPLRRDRRHRRPFQRGRRRRRVAASRGDAERPSRGRAAKARCQDPLTAHIPATLRSGPLGGCRVDGWPVASEARVASRLDQPATARPARPSTPSCRSSSRTLFGAGVVSIGVVEGVAEATASGLKVGSGYLSDRVAAPPRPGSGRLRFGRRASDPWIGLAGTWGHVLALALCRPGGEGVRSAPRDARLAAARLASIRGRVFGTHRAMATSGRSWDRCWRRRSCGVAGPRCARSFCDPRAERAGRPVLFRLPPDERSVGQIRSGALPVTDAGGVPRLPRSFYRLLSVLIRLHLGNSSDAFLLLQLSALGWPRRWSRCCGRRCTL